MHPENIAWLLDLMTSEARRMSILVENMQRNHQHAKDNVLEEAKKAGASKEVLDAIEALWSGK